MTAENKIKEISIVPINSIKPNPKNRNTHSPEQIDRLCELIKYSGFRSPLIISNLSGLLVVGHGRLEACKKIGLTDVPVIFQDFDSLDQEYAFMVSHNAIASWSSLDLHNIHADLGDLSLPSIDLLGIENFQFEPDIEKINKGDENSEWAKFDDFEKGDNYIKLTYIFGSEDERAKFVNDNSIDVKTKLKTTWLVYP